MMLYEEKRGRGVLLQGGGEEGFCFRVWAFRRNLYLV